MEKGLIIGISVGIVILIGVFFFITSGNTDSTGTTPDTSTTSSTSSGDSTTSGTSTGDPTSDSTTGSGDSSSDTSGGDSTTGTTTSGSPETHTVDLTSGGPNPQDLTISSGDTVVFTNSDSVPHWIASDNHPTHRIYPGSDLIKCNSGEANLIFDSCIAISVSGTYSFTFLETGTWGYHDHVNFPSYPRGSIIVQ